MSTPGRVGYVLWISGIMGAIWYPFQSWVTDWQHLNILIALGFVCVPMFGFFLLRQEHGVRFKHDKSLFAAGILTSIGLAFLASGLAWLDRLPGTFAWITTFAGGSILVVLGIIIAALQRNPGRQNNKY